MGYLRGHLAGTLADVPPGDIQSMIVAAGTPVPSDLIGVAVARGFPDASHDKWYYPSSQAFAAGRYQAAVDTIVSLPEIAGEVVSGAVDSIGNVVSTVTPYLVFGVLAAVLIFREVKK